MTRYRLIRSPWSILIFLMIVNAFSYHAIFTFGIHYYCYPKGYWIVFSMFFLTSFVYGNVKMRGKNMLLRLGYFLAGVVAFCYPLIVVFALNNPIYVGWEGLW